MTLKGPSYRTVASHFIIFAILIYTFFTLGFTLTDHMARQFLVTPKAFYTVTGCFAFPLVLALILLYGLLRDKILFVRFWLLSMIPLTVILLFLLLSGAIYMAIDLEIYWGVILCAMPFMLVLWMSEGIIVVFSYYKKVEAKTKKELPV